MEAGETKSPVKLSVVGERKGDAEGGLSTNDISLEKGMKGSHCNVSDKESHLGG